MRNRSFVSAGRCLFLQVCLDKTSVKLSHVGTCWKQMVACFKADGCFPQNKLLLPSKHASTCFETGGHLFQNRLVLVLKGLSLMVCVVIFVGKHGCFSKIRRACIEIG